MVEHFDKVGIKAHVEALEKAAFSEMLYKTGNYNMSIGEFVPHGLCDDDMMLVLQHGEKKTDLLPYPERDTALQTWKQAGTRESRLEASYELQKLINQYPKRIMLWYPHGFFAYNKNAYDNYSIIKGYNIFNKYSFLPNEARKGFILENFSQEGLGKM